MSVCACVCLFYKESAKAAEALLLDKEAFLPSHKYLMDKARVIHANGRLETGVHSFFDSANLL